MLESALIICGVAASLLIQIIKGKMGTNEAGTLIVLVLISIAIATFYVLFNGTEFFATLQEILIVAGSVYSYFWLRFEKKPTGCEIPK